ncbi:MAG: M28 family peptidase [Bacteroidetes bacterium]|nr:M28 family peptidase [Bacteroidota bacterium]
MKKRWIVTAIVVYQWTHLSAQWTFSLTEARTDIQVLTSPEYGGRGHYKNGARRAASYVERRFQVIGLQPVNGTYMQKFPLKVNRIIGKPFLAINGREFRLGIDFLPHSLTSSGFYCGSIKAFYVKSGLLISEKGINDFATVTEQHCALLIDDDIPEAIRNDTTVDVQRTLREVRIENAKKNIPRVVLVLQKNLHITSPHISMGVPLFSVRKTQLPPVVDSLVFHVVSLFDTVESVNIVGLVRGTVYPDSFLILCAHYDHHSGYNDSLYFPGANDNASGVALLLQLASTFIHKPLAYSVLFIAFGGEEVGLVGSRYFIEHPLVQLSNIVSVFNFDMVASGDCSIEVGGEEDFSWEYAFFSSVNASSGVQLNATKTSLGSNHYPFVQNGIRAFFLIQRTVSNHTTH